MRRWRRAPALAVILLLPLLSACSSGWSQDAVAKGDQGVQLQVINSQVTVGAARLAFGLFADNGTLVQDATGRVRLFHLDGDKAEAAGEYDLRAISIHDTTASHAPLATMYIAYANIDRKGDWGAELIIEAGGKHIDHLRTRFLAQETGTVPEVGAPAPRTTQPVLRDVKDITEIDSSTPPRPALHTMTVAEAIDSKKPTVVAFATPAFCQTRFCGPVVDEVVEPLSKDYAGRANFIHIEPYKLAEARQGRLIPIDEMTQWGLATEPYIFVIDATGRVAAQFEGITAKDEVAAVLDRLLKG
jgi:hypothetical protein